MWSRRALLVLPLFLLPALGGCGFHPLYGGQSTFGYDPDLAAISVRPIPDRIGQILAMSLREQLNPRGASLPQRYSLSVGLDLARSDLGIRTNATAARGRIVVTADYLLTETARNNAVYSDRITAITSFNLPDDAYAATVEEAQARERAVEDVSRQIATKLALFMRQKRGS